MFTQIKRMKSRPILRWILEQLLHLLLYAIGLIVCLFIYPFINVITKHKTPFLWWFLNDTPDTDNDGGNFGSQERNFIGFYKQCAIINSHWNLRLKMGVQKGKTEDVKIVYSTLKSPLTLCNLTILGKQKVFYSVNGVRYFRMSKSVKYKNNTRLFNYQFGYSEKRAIFKIRNVKI